MCRFLVVTLLLALAFSPLSAQEEMGDISTPSRSWTMLSVHRVWTPQANDMPNGGFGVNAFFSVDADRRAWAGFSIVGTGLVKRDALAINAGMGWWFLGDSSLGAFAYGMTGLGITSANGLTGFDFFSDPTSTYGLASQAGLGGAVEIFTNLKIHLNAYGLWFTNDGGVTPYGLQLGLTFGGR
ncbi:MAG: hypothetical protein EHM43_02320 [Ignavibacteriae bacterium]|nr:MAG: hypothetical protein EHM43_02320 [Ignavibacteriota bacterium]